MIVRLFCPVCAFAATKRLPHAEIEVPLPIARLSDDGRYDVHCQAGHTSTVFLDNLKFELLFEMGLNALLDGYAREAVSSFTSSLERFYEFYWHVAMAHIAIPEEVRKNAWKPVAKQSERQLGAYVTAHLFLTKTIPPLLNPNVEVKLRNEVIHGGYIPTFEEAKDYGDLIMKLVNDALDELRKVAPDVLLATYKLLSPVPREDKGDEELRGVINVMTAVDVRNPIVRDDDPRRGCVVDQFKRIIKERIPHKMQLFTDKEARDRAAGSFRQDNDEM